ncbi:dna-directed rna polymerase iii subunit rpc2 [Gossypium arboreum]|uniref:Dna-directed rna polymerase iii subunit rpc2 n=1 Tax=Gossypium arboreum TaxID=29729 RepID=A0A0B0Q0J4_GOSAR|nr:dna-directed rna polymerase iii subunit rpc2 [Gossypium arboreum]
MKQQLDSFDYFVNTGIKKIVRVNDRIVSDIDPSIYLRYSAPIFVNGEYFQVRYGQKTRLEKASTQGDEKASLTEAVKKCGLLGYYSHKLKTGICSSCKNGDNVSTMKLLYACKLLIQARAKPGNFGWELRVSG